jgi:hypothetical protein
MRSLHDVVLQRYAWGIFYGANGRPLGGGNPHLIPIIRHRHPETTIRRRARVYHNPWDFQNRLGSPTEVLRALCGPIDSRSRDPRIHSVSDWARGHCRECINLTNNNQNPRTDPELLLGAINYTDP